jgi:PKD repeat protein
MRSLFLASSLSLALIGAASAQTLSTSFAGGTVLTGFAGAQTMYFDLTVLNPAGVFVSQFDVRCQAVVGFSLPGTLDIYRTAVGSTNATLRNTPSAWRRIGTAPINAVGAPAIGLLNNPFYLAPGTYGFALHHINVQPVYFNPGTSTGAGFTLFANADLSIDTTAGVAQASTPTVPIGGGVSAAPRSAGVTITYATAGHTTDFTVSPANGTTPLAFAGASPQSLTFTDESHTSDPGGLLPLWDWDFDGDGIVDQSTGVPTVAHNYTTCGTFNVRVTSYDAVGGVSLTKNAFVTIDPVTPNFTFTKVGDPAVIQFTDTSTGATGWQWNLDGLPGIESTAQNPTFAYTPGCTPISVTLTATNACRSVSVTKPVVPEPSLPTLLTGTNNSGNAGGALYFDANILNTDGVQICGFSVNCNDPLGNTPIQVTFWERLGTSVGFESTAVGWTNRGAVLATSKVRDLETAIMLPTPVYLAPGVHGFAIQMTGVGQAYSNIPTPGASSYANADIALSLGSASNAAFVAPLILSRSWSGRINYKTVAQGLSGYHKFASGCAGTAGVPGNVGVALPTIGTNFQVNFPQTPFGCLVFYGFSNTLAGGAVPLPIDAGFLGAPGCPILIDPAVTGPLLIGANPTWTEALPLTNTLVGIHFYTQAFSLELPGFNALGGALSDGAAGVIGS